MSKSQIGDTATEINLNRKEFENLIYTPLDEALVELSRRWVDQDIQISGVPESMRDGYKAGIFRHIATSNYEIRRFISICDATPELSPLVLEYTQDRFTNANDWKYSLGKLCFFKEYGKNHEIRTVNQSIIDFNVSNGKAISDVVTLWGETLVQFHHEMFDRAFPKLSANRYDLSEWLKKNGQNAREYYKAFFTLFIKHGILFENFLLEGDELPFTQEVIIPAFSSVVDAVGYKPLIVALEPTDIEGDKFWLCHPLEDKEFVKIKLKRL